MDQPQPPSTKPPKKKDTNRHNTSASFMSRRICLFTPEATSGFRCIVKVEVGQVVVTGISG